MEEVKNTPGVWVDENTKAVFENALNRNDLIKFNVDKYMYMYTKHNSDFFKHKETRDYVSVFNDRTIYFKSQEAKCDKLANK
tara:strand:- start:871 stop:1116 length:246 start_codon:yes stop_codon:yes gene_type:complete